MKLTDLEKLAIAFRKVADSVNPMQPSFNQYSKFGYVNQPQIDKEEFLLYRLLNQIACAYELAAKSSATGAKTKPED